MNVDQYISSGVLELYALHALPPEQMKEVEDMVEKHPRVKKELEAISEGLKKYAEHHSPEPSEGLFDKIIDKINQAPAQPQEEVPAHATPIVPIKKTIEINDGAANRVVADKPITRRIGAGYWMSVAASIILLIISVSLNFYYYGAYHDTEDKLVAMQAEKNTVAANNTTLKASYDESQAKLKVFTDPKNKMVMMEGMPISPASEVMVIWNPENKDVYVDVHRLPAPPDGMQYQLWAIDETGKPVDAGMLTPYKERTDKGVEQMSKKIGSAVAFAITLERRGGSPTPTIDKMYVKGGVKA